MLVCPIIFNTFLVNLLYGKKETEKKKTRKLRTHFEMGQGCSECVRIDASVDDRRVFIAMEKEMTLLCVILSTHVHTDTVSVSSGQLPDVDCTL